MSIEALPFERRPRNSIANNLDKINELVDWVNLDTHLYASASGERVTVDDESSLKGLMVDGRSVQDGTPTPDAPVPVQVVEGPLSLVIGDASVAINLQGNTLASLPDGTRDELHIDSAGHVWIESISWIDTIASVGTINTSGSNYYASITPTDASNRRNWSSLAEYNSQPGTPRAWCSKCTSDGTGIYIARTWNSFYAYAPASLGLTQEDFDKLVGAEFVAKNKKATIDLGYIDPPAIPSGSVVTISASLTPTFHLEWWVDDGITELVNELIAYVDYKTEG